MALALGVGGCGGGSGADSAATVDSSTSTIASPPPSAPPEPRTTASKPASKPAHVPCSAELNSFLGQLDHLRRNLVIGVSYEQYVAELGAVRRTYEKLPVARLDLACISGAAAAAEESFDGYLAAANTWGDCVSRAGCETATLEPKLQSEWRLAARALRRAQRSA